MRQRSNESIAFEHYLRTGRRLRLPESGEAKFNPYHDPENGRFTFAPGGPRIPGASAANPSGTARFTVDDPIGDIIRNSKPDAAPKPVAPSERAIAQKPAEHLPKPFSTAGIKVLTHWPIEGATIRSLNRPDKPHEGAPTFGASRGTKGTHRGIDIKAPEGTLVRAAGDGKIVAIRPNPSTSFGEQIVIDHLNGVFTEYARLQRGSTMVKPGTKVKAGQPIARVGRTGNTPPAGDSHLHFEVRLGSPAPATAGGHPRDPLKFLPR